MSDYNELVEIITREVLNKVGDFNNSCDYSQKSLNDKKISENKNNEVLTPQKLARYIDHTLLKPDSEEEAVLKLCKEALEYNFASVCINPCWVNKCFMLLKDSDVKVCTVIGFPLGATYTDVKVAETKKAISEGAGEIDMVINIGFLKSRKYQEVKEDIRQVKKACKDTLLKVIIETCLLTSDEKIKACELAREAGADYVKTSTGMSVSGATVEDIALMRRIVGEKMGVKASGGVRDYDGAKKMIRAGASRIGASSSVSIIKGQYVHTGY
ncbi:MAG: deoxyribose-phosphate aldolase [Candidatus Muiribacteriota bacterium]